MSSGEVLLVQSLIQLVKRRSGSGTVIGFVEVYQQVMVAVAPRQIPFEDSATSEAVLAEAGYDVELISYSGDHFSAPLELLVQTVLDAPAP